MRLDEKTRMILVLLLSALCLPAWSGAQERKVNGPIIITGHPDRPPFAYQDGDHIVGFAPDLAGIILSRLGIPYESRYLGPWKRVQELARYGKVDLIAGIYRNIEREAYLDFSEPFFEDPTSIFALREKAFTVSGLEDLVGRRGVTLFGDSFGEHLDRFIDKELRMIRAYSTREMFADLLSGKADYVLFGHYSGLISVAAMDAEDAIVVIKKGLVVEKIHLAITRQSPHVHLLPAINREIRRLQDEGRIDALLNEHMNRYLLRAN